MRGLRRLGPYPHDRAWAIGNLMKFGAPSPNFQSPVVCPLLEEPKARPGRRQWSYCSLRARTRTPVVETVNPPSFRLAGLRMTPLGMRCASCCWSAAERRGRTGAAVTAMRSSTSSNSAELLPRVCIPTTADSHIGSSTSLASGEQQTNAERQSQLEPSSRRRRSSCSRTARFRGNGFATVTRRCLRTRRRATA